jgi:SRSO17 transposase
VARQWCGRLGKKENCQTGVFAAYVSERGQAPLDCQLYLPEEWAEDRKRRAATYVPREVHFQEKWRIALDLVDRCAPEVKHGWVTGDDEFGRVTEFRAQLRVRGERYVVDVPCNTLVREIGEGTKKGKFERVDAWAARQRKKDWKTITVREGSKGSLRYRAIKRRVQTKDSDGRVGPTETVLVMQSLGKEPQTWYALSNAGREVKLAALVVAKQRRHGVEEVFHDGKGQVGLGHYEVRSWVGWHHHMTLSMLALWFLLLEKEQLGKKNTGHHRATGSRDYGEPPARPAAERGRNRRARDPGAAA